MKRKVLLAISGAALAVLACVFTLLSASAQTVKPASVRAGVSPTPSPIPKPTVNEDDEPIRVETELVNLNVRVVDRTGRTINDLPEKEFKIYEDGVLQKIESFSKYDVPTNYGIVVDNSGSIAPQLEKVIEAGNILINQNKPADETMVIRFIGRDKIEILQEFTSSKTDLLDSLDQFMERGWANRHHRCSLSRGRAGRRARTL